MVILLLVLAATIILIALDFVLGLLPVLLLMGAIYAVAHYGHETKRLSNKSECQAVEIAHHRYDLKSCEDRWGSDAIAPAF